MHALFNGSLATVSVSSGQGLKQIGELALAFGLSSLIGLERERRQKSAGLRAHTLVGFGAALLLIVSKYGFSDVLGSHVTLSARNRVSRSPAWPRTSWSGSSAGRGRWR
jgi:hypothetical protein